MAGLPLFTLREVEVIFKDSGKAAKLNKRTEQLLNENCHCNISCLNEDNFFYFFLFFFIFFMSVPFVEQATEKKTRN